MSYKIVHGPFMLMETTWMLYRYVNKVTFQQDLNVQKYLRTVSAPEGTVRRMNCLQKITEEVCRDVDIRDPQMQRFFGNQEVNSVESVDTCLALQMTLPFCTLKTPGFRENVEEICGIWHRIQSSNAWILPDSGGLLQFSNEPGDHGDLFDQVRALNLSPEFRMELFDALRNFDRTMKELADLMEPIAQRLEAALRQESWLLDELVDYWEELFSRSSVRDVLSRLLAGVEQVRDDIFDGDWVVGICLMLSKNLAWHSSKGSLICPDYSFAYIGCGIDDHSQRTKRGDDFAQIRVILKALSDKNRLEILHQLSRKSSYCYELAEVMGMDYGNLSRILTTLHNYGFLRQKRDLTRNYYETDSEAIHEFFQLLESIICQ